MALRRGWTAARLRSPRDGPAIGRSLSCRIRAIPTRRGKGTGLGLDIVQTTAGGRVWRRAPRCRSKRRPSRTESRCRCPWRSRPHDRRPTAAACGDRGRRGAGANGAAARPRRRGRRRDRRRVRERLRGREGGQRAGAGPAVSRRADAEARRVRGARSGRPRRAGRLRHGVRRVRAARVRRARGGLPAEAVQPRAAAARRSRRARARTTPRPAPAALREAARPASAADRARRDSRRRQRARRAGGEDRLRRSAGRLRRVPYGRPERC